MIISERIFKIMEEKDINQITFSRVTGISQSTISDWKRKKTNPAADKIMKICNVLGVSPYELLQDADVEGCEKQMDAVSDYVIISENSDKYKLLAEYEKLDKSSKDHLFGYLKALSELNKKSGSDEIR